MPFEVTTAVRKMLAMTARKKVIQGATSSGKTYGIIPILVDRCVEKKRKVTVVAESIPAVKDGAVQIFKDFMQDEGRWREDGWIGNPMEYTFLNGSKIQFKSFDSVGKAKAAGKRDILFINEANHIPYNIADALIIRSQEVWIDFNADSEFWAHTELLHQPNSEFLKLTYLDNEYIPEPTLQDMLYRKQRAEEEEKQGIKGYHWNWWQVYGLGEIGSLQGAIFSTFEQVKQEEINDAQLLALGLDWGFTNDPTALVAVYRKNGKVLLHELIYEAGLTNQDIGERMKALGVNKSHEIIADSAEPKSIEELRRMGFRMTAAVKGTDSVRQGIDILQRHDLAVTETSLNLIKELRNYKWATDKAGKTLNEPIDAWNHGVDSARYVALMKLKLANNGKYFILRS
jgi:phage terminase large subunit